MSKIQGENKRTFESGATRSREVENWRFDLAPACATRREAKIWAEGARVHGDDNWKKGLPIHVCLNHLEYHLNKYKDGDRTEDHLAKIGVNAAMAMFFEDCAPYPKRTAGDSSAGVELNRTMGGNEE